MELTHDRLLSECFLYTWNNYPQTRYCIFHVRNETSKRYNESTKEFIGRLARDKACGIIPGILDLYFDWFKPYGFDIKIGPDKLSEQQQSFIAHLRKRGGNGYEIRNIHQFTTIFDDIMKSYPLINYAQ